MSVIAPEEQKEQSTPAKPSLESPIKPYTEPRPYIDATSDFEEMDRGIGWGIDDHPTYHRTEK